MKIKRVKVCYELFPTKSQIYGIFLFPLQHGHLTCLCDFAGRFLIKIENALFFILQKVVKSIYFGCKTLNFKL